MATIGIAGGIPAERAAVVARAIQHDHFQLKEKLPAYHLRYTVANFTDGIDQIRGAASEMRTPERMAQLTARLQSHATNLTGQRGPGDLPSRIQDWVGELEYAINGTTEVDLFLNGHGQLALESSVAAARRARSLLQEAAPLAAQVADTGDVEIARRARSLMAEALRELDGQLGRLTSAESGAELLGLGSGGTRVLPSRGELLDAADDYAERAGGLKYMASIKELNEYGVENVGRINARIAERDAAIGAVPSRTHEYVGDADDAELDRMMKHMSISMAGSDAEHRGNEIRAFVSHLDDVRELA